jgi:hypothetical protein
LAQTTIQPQDPDGPAETGNGRFRVEGRPMIESTSLHVMTTALAFPGDPMITPVRPVTLRSCGGLGDALGQVATLNVSRRQFERLAVRNGSFLVLAQSPKQVGAGGRQ